jgi:L-ascorbate metabolism protein UlaG (beta-lactamase superfamily)
VLTVAAVAAAATWAVHDLPAAFGARPSGERAARMRRSPQFRDGAFRNPVPSSTVPSGSSRKLLRDLLFGEQVRRPSRPVPVMAPPAGPATGPGGLRATWYGHSTALVDIEGVRVLFDPVWSERCSPSRLVGPRRLHPAPAPLADLPPIDAIVISHDHYDHLDMDTVRALADTQSAPFVVPLGVGAHLERWGVPAVRIVELDWDESTTIGAVRLTAAAARHFSGRTLARDGTLWASWILAGPARRVFYTGDSGYFDGYAAIGAAHGPFDLTLMQIGAYGEGWPDIHMTPEEGIAAHLDLRGDLMIPLHWATFTLAFHDWAEPADRAWLEAKARGVRLAVPRPGEPVDVDDPPQVDGWWREIA